MRRNLKEVGVGAQDTFYVGNLKSVGRIYQQTFIDTLPLAKDKMLQYDNNVTAQ